MRGAARKGGPYRDPTLDVKAGGDTDITEYEWDHRNRLAKVTHYTTQSNYASDTADKIFEYAYDHQNRWVRKIRDTDGDGTVDESAVFVYDGNQIALHFQDADAVDLAAADLDRRYP